MEPDTLPVLFVADREADSPLLADLRAGVAAVLERTGRRVETVVVGPEDVVPCTGCLRCFKAEDGACVNKDAVAALNLSIQDFGLLVYFGPIVFGQYSWVMKTVMDKADIWKMMRSRHVIAVGCGDGASDAELRTFCDIVRKHRGPAEKLHRRFKERFEVFASNSLLGNDDVCRQLREHL